MNNDDLKIKIALDYYLKKNKLKNIMCDGLYDISVANYIYNSLILALSVNGEYNITNNIFSVIKDLLNIPSDKTDKDLLKSINIYNIEVTKFLSKYFYTSLKEEDIKKLFSNFNNDYIINLFGECYDKNYEIFRFFVYNSLLSRKERSVWDSRHWNIQTEKIERISDHVVGTIYLSYIMNEKFNFNINIENVIKTLIMHEIGEILIGDITPYDGISNKNKIDIEHNAINKVLGLLSIKNNVIDLLFAFDEKNNNDAYYSYLFDKLEAQIQSKIYQDCGWHNSLNNQSNNVVFKDDFIKGMIDAKTPYDIWYLADVDKFRDKTLKKTLDYVKDHNLKKHSL